MRPLTETIQKVPQHLPDRFPQTFCSFDGGGGDSPSIPDFLVGISNDIHS